MPLFDKKAKEFVSGSYSIMGNKISCPLCKNDVFEVRDVLLNTPGMTFLGLDWANRTAVTLTCIRCGKIEWFLQKPERI